MPIYSGSHELFGEMEFSTNPEVVLKDWLDTQRFDNRFDERDERWWVEEVALIQGSRVILFDESRSSYTMVDKVARFVDHIIQSAVSGHVVLQHVENGVHVIDWNVAKGRVQRHETTVKRKKGCPASMDDARADFNRKSEEHTRLRNALSPSERFEEVLIRYAPTSKGILVEGVDSSLRNLALKRLAEAGARPILFWEPGASLPDTGTVVVANLALVPPDEQAKLVHLLRESQLRVIAGIEGSAKEAIIQDKLREDLYYRLSLGLIDLERVHP